ncbi:MAG TPA: hypothetical protein IAB59_01315 [Candidatus Onthousia faecipullorum]|uniref:Uncharacterized protein n=1 Tax=Candidatus Onthousia faecipullorum TaxID=2840887 RepID=A0A9D1GAS8_9FIRM|nr:hypothetical protein [Candidatus Onthousia faecipullorum]
MKEATGELNMTVVTIVLIGVIAAFFAFFWPTIQESIQDTWNDNTSSQSNVDFN